MTVLCIDQTSLQGHLSCFTHLLFSLSFFREGHLGSYAVHASDRAFAKSPPSAEKKREPNEQTKHKTKSSTAYIPFGPVEARDKGLHLVVREQTINVVEFSSLSRCVRCGLVGDWDI